MANKDVKISIPYELSEKLKSKMSSANYDSIEAYVNYILSQLISSDEPEENSPYGGEGEENVKEMLKDLGYI